MAEYQEGITKSFHNAQRYYNDAVFLYQNGKLESSILLSMLSFEESGKAIILVDYAKKQQIISKTAWLKKLCSHVKKNLACYKLMWEEANISEIFEGQQASTSKFQQDWKNVYTYVDYDFKNKKWTSPIDPKTFLNTGNSKAFSYSALLNAARALEVVNKKITEYNR